MHRRNFQKIIILLFFCLCFFLGTKNTLAIGNAGPGYTPSGDGKCSNWGWCDDRGVTWAWYKLKKNIDKPVHLYASKNMQAVDIYGCKKGQTLFNYGFIAFDNYGNSYDQQVGTVGCGPNDPEYNTKGKTFKGARDVNPLDTYGVSMLTFKNDYYDRVGYAPYDEVKNNYNRMVEAGAGVDGIDSFDKGLGWFCFDPDVVYYNYSTVTIIDPQNNKTTSGNTDYVQENKEITVEKKVKQGDEITIEFTQDVYTDIEINETNREIYNKYTLNVTNESKGKKHEGFKDNHQVVNCGNNECMYILSNFYDKNIGKYRRDYVSGNVQREHYSNKKYTITFDEPGEYNFCQSLTRTPGEDDADNEPVTTTACAKITVAPASQLQAYAKVTAVNNETNVQNEKSTGIVSNGTTTLKIAAKPKESITLTFAGELLSKEKIAKPQTISWVYNMTGTNDNNINIQKWLRGGFANKKITENIKGKNITEGSVNEDELKKAKAGNTLAGYYAKYEIENYYLVGNQLELSIEKEGNYTICQNLSGAYNDKNASANSCVEIEVTKDGNNGGSCTCEDPNCKESKDAPCDDKDDKDDEDDEGGSGSQCASLSARSDINYGENVASSLITSNNGNSGTSIYVKPNDLIWFNHCFFPGVQATRKNEFHGSHDLTDGQKDILRDKQDKTTKYYDEYHSVILHEFTDDNLAFLGNRSDGSSSKFNNSKKIVTDFNRFRIETLGTGFNGAITFTSNFKNNGGTTNVYFSGDLGKNTKADTESSQLQIATTGVGTEITQNLYSDYKTIEMKGEHNFWETTWGIQYCQWSHDGKTFDGYDNIANDAIKKANDAADAAIKAALEPYGNSDVNRCYRTSSEKSGSSASCIANCPKDDDDSGGGDGDGDDGEDDGDGDDKPLPLYYASVYASWQYATVADAEDIVRVYHNNDDDDSYYQPIIDYYSSAASSATAKIPYNYTTSADAPNIKSDKIYSGESFALDSATIRTNTRYNQATRGEYATKTQPAEIILYAFSDSPNGSASSQKGKDEKNAQCRHYSEYSHCEIVKIASGTVLNSIGEVTGSQEDFFKDLTISAYDLEAGSRMCVAVSVYPASSNGDTDMNKTATFQDAYYSSPSCQKVYKRPSFQVWGGGIFNAGKTSAIGARKKNLDGQSSTSNYNPNNDNRYYFAPWVEQAIVLNDGIISITSGAATGYTTNNKGNLINNPGGSILTNTTSSECRLLPLTIQNKNICENTTQTLRANIVASRKNSFENIYDSIIRGKNFKEVTGGTIDLSDSKNYNQTGMTRYTKKSNVDLTIYSSRPLGQATTHVIYAEGNITISGNLTYEDTLYNSSSQIPQYIIYAKKGIKINCGVTRVDAFLVSEGEINTCADGGDVNDEKRSNQLIINGAIVAKKLNLTRTYGASTGNNSSVPAEIINFSLTTRFYSMNAAADRPILHSVYTKELAPRY